MVEEARTTVTGAAAGLLGTVDEAVERFFTDVLEEEEDVPGFGFGVAAGLKPYPFLPLVLFINSFKILVFFMAGMFLLPFADLAAEGELGSEGA